MRVESLETDYLVFGGGAMGVAFADEVLASDKTARVILVDKHSRLGGHWNDAYSYVTLHQPAAFYGVNSENLGPGGSALVSGTEVLSYYERVLEKLCVTGRFRFFPLCTSDGDASFRSLADPGLEYRVKVGRKVVDATYMKVEVPSIRPPQYAVAEGVGLISPNELPKLSQPPSGYVVIGAGKTGIDAVLFLLDQAVDPDRIRWIMPNDAWLFDRAKIVPGEITESAVERIEAFAQAENLQELFRIQESQGSLLRLDPAVEPTRYRCATVSLEEFQKLKRVRNIVRMGRVKRIEPNSIVLEEGSIPTDSEALHVDCTADGLAKRSTRPVFEGDRITLQSLSMCQQVFSASVIGQVETRFENDQEKNALCQPVPHPYRPKDYLVCTRVTNQNVASWLRAIPRWVFRSRLSMFHHDGLLKFLLGSFRMRKSMATFEAKLEKFIREEYSDAEKTNL